MGLGLWVWGLGCRGFEGLDSKNQRHEAYTVELKASVSDVARNPKAKTVGSSGHRGRKRPDDCTECCSVAYPPQRTVNRHVYP